MSVPVFTLLTFSWNYSRSQSPINSTEILCIIGVLWWLIHTILYDLLLKIKNSYSISLGYNNPFACIYDYKWLFYSHFLIYFHRFIKHYAHSNYYLTTIGILLMQARLVHSLSHSHLYSGHSNAFWRKHISANNCTLNMQFGSLLGDTCSLSTLL